MNTTSRHEQAKVRFAQLEGNPLACTREEISWEMAAEAFLTPESIGGWIESAGQVRESSAFWGPISNYELLRIIFGSTATPEQRDQAVITIRRRFFAEHSAEIAERAANF